MKSFHISIICIILCLTTVMAIGINNPKLPNIPPKTVTQCCINCTYNYTTISGGSMDYTNIAMTNKSNIFDSMQHAPDLNLTSDSPEIILRDINGGGNRKEYRIFVDNDVMYIQRNLDTGVPFKNTTYDVDGNWIFPNGVTIQGTTFSLAGGANVYTTGKIGLNTNNYIQMNTADANAKNVWQLGTTDNLRIRSSSLGNFTTISQAGIKIEQGGLGVGISPTYQVETQSAAGVATHSMVVRPNTVDSEYVAFGVLNGSTWLSRINKDGTAVFKTLTIIPVLGASPLVLNSIAAASMTWQNNGTNMGTLTWDGTTSAEVLAVTGKSLGLGANGNINHILISTTGNVAVANNLTVGKKITVDNKEGLTRSFSMLNSSSTQCWMNYTGGILTSSTC